METRAKGFYWVKRIIIWVGPPLREEIVWEVAKYEYGHWYLADGSVAEFNDYYFLEIDDRRLVRE